jgi:hypothetical protein
MKLKLFGKFGQRNPKWASELLGYNTQSQFNIGMYGCLITSFSCYINKNPHEVNELLKANNGFINGGDFVWSKSTVLGLSQFYQSPYYSDPVTPQGLSKMRSLLDEGRPLITHIDFDPSDPDDDQHWLIVYGYDDNDVFYCHDPWTDLDITLDVYGGAKRCIFEWRSYDKILQKDIQIDLQSELDQCRIDRDRNWTWFTTLCDTLGVGANIDAAVNEVKKLVGNDDILVQKDKENQQLKTQVTDLQNQVNQAKISINDQQDLLNVKLNEIEELKKTNTQNVNLITVMQKNLDDLSAQIIKPVYKGWKLALIKLIESI